MVITGTRKGIGKYLVEYYIQQGYFVYGCSRQDVDFSFPNYHHSIMDVFDESAIKKLISTIRASHGRLDVLINNAGIASMNHALLTPIETMQKAFNTNVFGAFLFMREAAKLMKKNHYGRIVNFVTIATPLNLEGEASYASSKGALESLTKVMAKDFADFGITINALGPTPVDTDLLRNVPQEKIDKLISFQAIKRYAKMEDISNAINFFIQPESEFITGQIIYLGGIS